MAFQLTVAQTRYTFSRHRAAGFECGSSPGLMVPSTITACNAGQKVLVPVSPRAPGKGPRTTVCLAAETRCAEGEADRRQHGFTGT